MAVTVIDSNNKLIRFTQNFVRRLSHAPFLIIDRRPRTNLLFCTKHLFVAAIETGPRPRR